ncbi:hypothetical protein GRF29_28g448543 [Pseudopithomyces chartarum]|uniref:Uncharacterized protein n=1 Tax=Pseudopithomyces chartarum TaxID=1892770 RepID=A0AAN6RHN0_9PLEO|nr:hypothetical protein GRF29_28g448543 [Pseudopithomyces chartarum]
MPSSAPTPSHPPLHAQSPFQSPNAIPPRTSSHGITSGVKHRSSVLRPLSEVDWISQSKKSKLFHVGRTQAPAPLDPARTHNITAMGDSKTAFAQAPLPPDPQDNIGNDLIYGHRKGWTEENERILLGPYDYLVGHPGKDIRSQCIAAFNKWLKVPPERLEVITRVVGMLHTASLLYIFSAPRPSISHANTPPPASTTSKTPPSSAAASLSQTPSSGSRKRSTPQTTSTSAPSKSSSRSPTPPHPHLLRRTPQPAPRPGHGTPLARQPHLPLRSRIPRDGRQQNGGAVPPRHQADASREHGSHRLRAARQHDRPPVSDPGRPLESVEYERVREFERDVRGFDGGEV